MLGVANTQIQNRRCQALGFCAFAKELAAANRLKYFYLVVAPLNLSLARNLIILFTLQLLVQQWYNETSPQSRVLLLFVK